MRSLRTQESLRKKYIKEMIEKMKNKDSSYKFTIRYKNDTYTKYYSSIRIGKNLIKKQFGIKVYVEISGLIKINGCEKIHNITNKFTDSKKYTIDVR